MPKESQKSKAERVSQISRSLSETYPDAHCELVYSNPLELLIATILSAQCTDKQVNIVTKTLFQKYRSAADYADVTPEELEEDIRRIGLFRAKAKNIVSACKDLVAIHGGSVPSTMSALTSLAGVGRKTANVVLGNAFGINEGIVVDTHVARLVERLALTVGTTPESIERELMRLVPQDDWCNFSHWLIWHGRRRCSARKPDCRECEILAHCPTGRKNDS